MPHCQYWNSHGDMCLLIQWIVKKELKNYCSLSSFQPQREHDDQAKVLSFSATDCWRLIDLIFWILYLFLAFIFYCIFYYHYHYYGDGKMYMKVLTVLEKISQSLVLTTLCHKIRRITSATEFPLLSSQRWRI